MRIFRFLCLIGLAQATLVVPATARDIFVNNTTGDDRFTGIQSQSAPDLSGPVRTIARALQRAEQGDRIILEVTGEPYRESISLVGSRHSGYSYKNFMIVGNGVILDGSAPVPAHAWKHFRGSVFRFCPPRHGHQQLFLDGKPAVQVPAGRLSDALPKLEPLQWCLHGGNIYFCVEKQKLPEDYALTYTDKRTGITLYHVERVDVVDLIIQGFQLDGINAHNSVRDAHLVGVTSRGNGRSGIAVGGASRIQIVDSLVGDNGRAQLWVEPYSETHLTNTELLEKSAPGLMNRGGRVYVDGKRVEPEGSKEK